jgi:hypothetical protein
MKSVKKVLILCYSSLNSDPRVSRQIVALRDEYEVYTAGYQTSDPLLPFVLLHKPLNEFTYSFHLEYPFLLRKAASLGIRIFDSLKAINRKKYFEKKYWTERRKKDLANLKSLKTDFDLILANDIETLPLALSIKSATTKVIFDSHEYHPREFDDNPEWIRTVQPFMTYLCRTYMGKADRMFTVCEGIARAYKEIFGVDALVLTNAPAYEQDLYPRETEAQHIKLIHHGATIRGRRIEKMIELAGLLDERFSFDFMLTVQDPVYLNELKVLAAPNKRIRFVDPVPTGEIAKQINPYDMGVYIIAPSNFNNLHSLPNKFFEFIQGRLALAIGPSPEMAKIVKSFGLGIVSPDFEPYSLAEALNKLSVEDIRHFKMKCQEAAWELSSEKNRTMLLKVVHALLFPSDIGLA